MTSPSCAFSGVTLEVVNRIRSVANAEYGVAFDPSAGTNGTATAHTPFGLCVVHFVHDSARSVIVLTLLKKPFWLPTRLLWSGFEEEIERCRRFVAGR